MILLPLLCAASPQAQVRFDHPHALCGDPVEVRLSCTAADARIVYTLDGTTPSAVHGETYRDAIQVATTTVMRTAALSDGQIISPVETCTYLFPNDVATQTGKGLPATWGENDGKLVPALYALHFENGSDELPRALRAIPSISIAMDPADLFGTEGGIYTHPKENGAKWERKGSAEWIEPDGSPGFRIDCGIRIHGGWSRRPEESPKHGFRLLFGPKHGGQKLSFPIFGPDGPKQFTTLVLRNGNNNSWLHPSSEERRRAEYIRDQWMRDSQRAMGYPSARGTFVHLYLNGLYWGVYNVTERPDADFAADNFGGSRKDYDVLRADKPLEGDREAFKRMMEVVDGGLSTESGYGAVQQWLDLREFADFLILNYYGANGDWDGSSNWYVIRRRPSGKFHFVVWDGERTLEGLDDNTIAFDSDNSPPRIFHRLCENPEFRELFAQRASALCSGDAPLSPEACARRFERWSSFLDSAILGEAARWGSYRRDVHPFRIGPYELYTRDQHWRPEVHRLLTDYFPKRTAVVLKQFEAQGLYPPTRTGAIGDFESQTDIGDVKHPGSAEYSPADHTYRITGSGANIWGKQDAFHFVYRKLSGDVTISADIKLSSDGKNAHRKGCLMVRQSLDADAPYADVAVHGDGLISLQVRKTKGGETTELQSPTKGPATVRLERKGNEFTLTVTPKTGQPKSVGPVSIELKDPVYCGLAVSSHEADLTETAVFSNVILNAAPAKE